MSFREKIYHVVFEANTKAGKTFDVLLIGLILFSIAVVMFESMHDISDQYAKQIYIIEAIISIIFTIEFWIRVFVVRKKRNYLLSFYGMIDFVALLPFYLGLFLTPGGESLMLLRALRLLRVFRVLKFTRYTKEGRVLMDALKNSKAKISVFLFAVAILIVNIGALMYLIEGEKNGFTSIPLSIYWTVVTLTTVGYGDITPHTGLGQFLASIVMIIGYGIIAVPTGIVSSELSKQSSLTLNTIVCPSCMEEGHEVSSDFCKHCGSTLRGEKVQSDG